MALSAVLFDLDGTLIDTSPGIFKCVNKTLEEMHFPTLGEELLGRYVGPPIYDAFRSVSGQAAADAQEAERRYRKEYAVTGVHEVRVYPGIRELVALLHAEGVKLGVSTLKRENMALIGLREFGVLEYFDCVTGTQEGTKRTKADIIRLTLEQLGGIRPEEAVLIGDTSYDAVGAQEAGVKFMAVSFGFGFKNEKDLAGYPNIGLAHSAEEAALLLRRNGLAQALI